MCGLPRQGEVPGRTISSAAVPLGALEPPVDRRFRDPGAVRAVAGLTAGVRPALLRPGAPGEDGQHEQSRAGAHTNKTRMHGGPENPPGKGRDV